MKRLLLFLTDKMLAVGKNNSYSELFKTFPFSKLCVHKQCSQRSCSCVEPLVILKAQFYVASSLLSVLKIAILMLS